MSSPLRSSFVAVLKSGVEMAWQVRDDDQEFSARIRFVIFAK